MNAKKIGLFLCYLHFIAFITTAMYIRLSTSPQAPLLWAAFAVFDFPASLLYMCVGPISSNLLDNAGDSIAAQLLYWPYLIHGVVGTVWWYFLPRLCTSRRFGGVWGRAPDSDVAK